MSIAQHYIKRLQERDNASAYKAWLKSVLPNYFHWSTSIIFEFVELYGYKIILNADSFTKYLKQFCWACTYAAQQNKEITFGYAMHDGCSDDFEWFKETIDTVEWMKVFGQLRQVGLFDNSKSGQRMQMEFPEFVWRLLHLSESRAYRRYAAIRENYEDDDGDSDGGPVGGRVFGDEYEVRKWGSK